MSFFLRREDALQDDRSLVLAVFFVLLAAYLATFSGLPDSPDSEVEFQSTSALARRHSFALGGTSESEAILGIVHQGRQGFNVRAGGPGREHEFFSWSGVGVPLVALPLYAAGAVLGRAFPAIEARNASTTHLGVARSEYFEHLLVGLRNPLLGALTGALLVIAARRAGARRFHAVQCGLSYGLCSFAWPQARGTLSDVQATALLFLAFVLAGSVVQRYGARERAHLWTCAGFGLALGGAFLTRAVLAPGVAVVALHFLFELWRARGPGDRAFPRREIVASFVPALACLAYFLWINQQRFGDPLEAGYGGVVGAGWFLRSPVQGLLGVSVSPGSGLLWFAPGLLLVVPWLVRELRSGARSLPLFVLAMAVAIGLPNTIIPSWHGAWSYGPRYLLPLIPFLWFPMGAVLGSLGDSSGGRTPLRLAAGALLTLGFVTALGGVLVEYNTNLDLSTQAARIAWPEVPGENELAQEEERFVRTKFDWRFAAPWAHWRIFLQRLEGRGETFSPRTLYFLDSDAGLRPSWERYQGFQHLAWVDLHRRLGGPGWPGPLLCLFVLALGVRRLLGAPVRVEE